MRFALLSSNCHLPRPLAYRMVTEAPATMLRLENAEGSIEPSGTCDLIAVRDTNHDAADTLATLSIADIELVMIGGRIQLASETILERLPLPARKGMTPLSIDGTIRWLRAPVNDLFA